MNWQRQLGVLAAGAIVVAATWATAQPSGRPEGGQRPNAQRADGSGQGDPAARFRPMIEAIRATPGCMGVEATRLGGSKLAIFAFFKDKQAAKAWYDHPMHLNAMKQMMPHFVPGPDHQPMEDVPDGVPVLAVAAITPGRDGGRVPPQISIELYTPLKGGLSFGGGFAPKGFAPDGDAAGDDAPTTRPAGE